MGNTYFGVDFGYSFEKSTVIVIETRGGIIYMRESDMIDTRGLTDSEKEIILKKRIDKFKEKYPGIIELQLPGV